MQYRFGYKDNDFYVEDVSLKEIAQAVGTPCYIYSYSTLVENFNVLRDAFSRIDPLICYSVKANSNLSVLKTFAKLGAGFDIVSGGELIRVLRADGDPSKIVFSGVGKTEEEMKAAIEAEILFFNIESIEELYVLNGVAKGLGKKARIALRVNPDIDPKTHPYISTGLKKSKFGIEIDRAVEVYKKAAGMEGIEIVGLDAHIGSQIFDLSPFMESVRKLVKLADVLRKEGINIQYIDIGGGLGIKYKKEDSPPHPKGYADIIMKEMDNSYGLILEPGRSLVGNAGALLTKVLYLKGGKSKNFVVVDAAMNDLIRPAFYDSYHEILTVDKSLGDDEIVDIVGPICESGDFFAKDRRLPKVKKDDHLVILSAGAYGFVMSSNYNTRPRVPEVIVRGGEFFVVREREKYEDLIRGEVIPDRLR
ncbi:MAG: diaminopimelate decarboxylase [Deltaproteobacteria bacterium]|nr:diaminopimelate decarboxylase [Deltaproteobacteria bacterium]